MPLRHAQRPGLEGHRSGCSWITEKQTFSTPKLMTPEIVEFLKSPLVQGDHRRAFLDLLECRYGRRFGNPWAFVEYAQAENLGLDFTAFAKQPPRETPRPQGDPAKHPHAARCRGRKVAIIAPREDSRARVRGRFHKPLPLAIGLLHAER